MLRKRVGETTPIVGQTRTEKFVRVVEFAAGVATPGFDKAKFVDIIGEPVEPPFVPDHQDVVALREAWLAERPDGVGEALLVMSELEAERIDVPRAYLYFQNRLNELPPQQG